MKLFDDFEAVKFTQENLILITRDGYVNFIYYPSYHSWKCYNGFIGNRITVANYEDVTREELTNAMDGLFPEKISDFIRLCKPSELGLGHIITILEEDYPTCFNNPPIYHAIHKLLLKSVVYHKSYLEVRKLLDNAVSDNQDESQLLNQIQEHSFRTLGIDIFKEEIRIVDGHDESSYFWITPVRVLDYSDTNELTNIAEFAYAEISIEEDDVQQYLSPFLYKHFDNELEANKKRFYSKWTDDDFNEQTITLDGFEWNLTYNFFTFESIKNILNDISDKIDELNAKQESDSQTALVIDFYKRFSYRMEYMLKIGEENGYDLISFMGP